MRVLSNVPDPRFGGPLKRSLSVARKLRNYNIETVFLVPTGDDVFVDRARSDGFECIQIDQPRIRSPAKIRDNFRFLIEFPQLIRKIEEIISAKGIDIVHANGPLNYAVALGTARSEASLVWHFNDTLTPSPLKQVSATLAKRWADEIIVAADAVDDYYFGGTSKTKTVYAPVNLEKFVSDDVQSTESELYNEFGIPDSATLVGTIGNINPAKGHEFLLDAFARLNEKAYLIIVGRRLDSQRSYHEKLQRKVQDLGIESRVTFAGWRNDIPEILSVLDVFVLASVTEACPTVVLEAMAMECPVVATDVGGVREQIPGVDFGWVVPPGSPEPLSKAIDTALSSEERCEDCTTNARRRVENIFSLEACVEDHVQIYRALNDEYTQ